MKKSQLLERIASAAGELFLSKGYVAVTMEQVAVQADVSKRTLYKYFPAKEAILAHLLEDELAHDLDDRQLGLQDARSFREGASALLAESATWCEGHSDYLLPYIRYKFSVFEPGADAGSDRGLVPAWEALISAGQRHGELDTNRSAYQLAIYFHYLYLGALMRWITDRDLSLAGEFETVVRLFVEGAAAR